MARVYVAQHFSMPPEEVRSLLEGSGAADLVTAHPDGMVATYLPFVFDPDAGEHGALLTHVARNNSQARDPVVGEALVIVHGPDHYVSPRWLPSLATAGTVVPTWNYATVHAYGSLVVHDDPDWTRVVVDRMTAAHEHQYSVDQVPADYVERMLRAVVGLEIRLTRVEAKAKMSQNKAPDDVRGIIDGLHDEAVGGQPGAPGNGQPGSPAGADPSDAERRADLLAALAAGRGRSSTPAPRG
jgi:transcriptional regulator